MPFTPAHPAIVLPLLRKTWVSATGLVIGTLSPDFEYFFRVDVRSDFSHTLPGLFYFDVPVTVMLSLLFHLVVKENLIGNLPVFLQRRFSETRALDFKRFLAEHWLIFLLSSLGGAATHIFWDSFTHGDGYFAVNLPIIDQTYIPYGGGKYPLFYFLQHLSTCIGLVAITLYVLTLSPTEDVVNKPKIGYWIAVAGITGLVVLARLGWDNWKPQIGTQVVSMISGFCLAMIVTGFIKFKGTIVNIVDGQEKSVGTGRKA